MHQAGRATCRRARHPLPWLLPPGAPPIALPPAVYLSLPAGAHEFGHWQAAKQRGLELAPPLFIPAGEHALETRAWCLSCHSYKAAFLIGMVPASAAPCSLPLATIRCAVLPR